MIITADAIDGLKTISSASVDVCVTSPPYYGLRDYGVEGQIGLEKTPEEYINCLVDVFREVWRVLRDDGTLWIVIGDSYAGSGKGDCKPKNLIGIPWLLAFALRSDGWYLRQDIIWQKPNAMPESVKDRCTRSHEYIFMFSKNRNYYYDYEAIQEPAVCKDLKKFTDNREKQRGHSRRHAGFNGRYAEKLACEGVPEKRNLRSVWSVTTKPYKDAHFATFPPDLIKPCILAGSRPGGMVLDPFLGSGPTALVALNEGRDFIGIEINPAYAEMARRRVEAVSAYA